MQLTVKVPYGSVAYKVNIRKETVPKKNRNQVIDLHREGSYFTTEREIDAFRFNFSVLLWII